MKAFVEVTLIVPNYFLNIRHFCDLLDKIDDGGYSAPWGQS